MLLTAHHRITEQQWDEPQRLSTGPERDADGKRERSKRDNLLVASSWFDQATQETYLLHESWRSNLRCWVLGGTSNDTLATSCKGQLSLGKQRERVRPGT